MEIAGTQSKTLIHRLINKGMNSRQCLLVYVRLLVFMIIREIAVRAVNVALL